MRLMENRVRQWEEYWGVTPRFTDFFSTPGGKMLLEKTCLRREGQMDFDPEVFLFLLLIVVLPEEQWEKAPSEKEQKEAIQNFRRATESLKKLQDIAIFGDPNDIQLLIRRLEVLIKTLKMFSTGMFPALIGGYQISGNRPRPKRQRAKRKVVFFLTGYFKDLQWSKTSWEITTDFLKLAHLVREDATPKGISTWWSTTRKREVTPQDPIEPHQKSWVKLFHVMKDSVWGINEKEQTEADVKTGIRTIPPRN